MRSIIPISRSLRSVRVAGVTRYAWIDALGRVWLPDDKVVRMFGVPEDASRVWLVIDSEFAQVRDAVANGAVVCWFAFGGRPLTGVRIERHTVESLELREWGVHVGLRDDDRIKFALWFEYE